MHVSVSLADITRCRYCRYGPLAWYRGGKKPILAQVYENASGQVRDLYIETTHMHTWAVCRKVRAERSQPRMLAFGV